MSVFKAISSVLYLIFGIAICHSQDNATSSLDSNRDAEKGYPIFTTLPLDENLHFLNFNIDWDANGLVYLANGLGVGIYDGVNWDLIELPDKSRVFDIGIAPDGKIYVASMTEIGFLDSDQIGQLSYTSLKSRLPEEVRKRFVPVEYISIDGNQVSFLSSNGIYVWKDGKLKVLPKNLDTDNVLYEFHKNLIPTVEDGLIAFEQGKLKKIKNGHFFKNMTITGIEKSSKDG